jgi:hypothetical protein
MNITIKCPGCGQVLAVPPNLAGRQATCPQCKSPFQIPASAPLPRPLPMATPLTSPDPAGQSPARRGPPPLPGSARAAPSPAARGGGFDLESLGISADGSAYVSPNTTQGARMPGNGAGGRPAKTTWIVGAVCAGVVLVAAAVGGWMMFGAKAGIGDDARFLPDDADFVFTADAKSLLASGVGRRFKEKLPDLDQLGKFTGATKLKIEDFGRVTVGIRVAGEKGCAVVHFTRPIAIEDMPDVAKSPKSTVGSYTIYLDHDAAAAQIDPQSILFGSEKEVRGVLTRNGPAKMSDALAAAMNATDFSKPLAFAAATNGFSQMAAANGAGNPMMTAVFDQVRGAAAYADVGDDIRLTGIVVCKDSTAADNIRKQIEGAKAMFASFVPAAAGAKDKGAANVLNSLTVSTSGATVRASITIDANTIDTMMGPLLAGHRDMPKIDQPHQQQPDNTVKKSGKPRQRKPKPSNDPFGQ